MCKATSFLFLISLKTCLSYDSILNDTELVFSFMVHRHGDRAPLPQTIRFIGNSEKVIEATKRYGYGQLTNEGRMRGYNLGKFIRRRYNELLSPNYNRSEIYIRSTDSTRTKMTVLAAMAAVYPAETEDNWSNKINWTPVPYTTVPVKYDDMLAVLNCPVFVERYKRNLETTFAGMNKYTGLLNKLSNLLEFNLPYKSSTLFFMNDAFTSQKGLGIPFHPRINELLPEVARGANEAMEHIFGGEENIALQAGVLLKEFFEEVGKVLNGKHVPRVRIYSAHDVSVYQLASITRITPKIGVPKYGSLFSLELRRVLETGQYIVVPVYLKEPSAEEVYLHVDGCEDYCDLDNFWKLTSDYALNEKEWRNQCEYYDDYEMDSSSID